MGRFWVSLRLHVQLALASILVLTVTLAMVTWLNMQSTKLDLIQDTTRGTSSLTKSIAIFSINYVLHDKFDELETLLIEYAAFPGIQDITVTSADGQTLSQVNKQENDDIVVVYDYPLIQVPKINNHTAISIVDSDTNTLVIWQPIETSSLIGWVKMQVSLSHVDELQQNTIIRNIQSTVIAIITDILIIILILYNPSMKFSKVVSFSNILVDNPGKHINFSGGSSEIDSLIRALNESSTKLQQQKSLIVEKTEMLERLASVDLLTKIPNRASFIDSLDSAIKNAKRNKSKLIVIFIDLNDFKPINDNYGHYIGDMLLQQFAARLEGSVRESDTVARYGGDEFVILLNNILGEVSLQDVVSNIVNAATGNYSIEGQSFDITLSLGLAVYPDDGVTSTELLTVSDHNMYKDKKANKNI